ncbi:hypothetical protein SAMN05216251_102541 [Actinacidiphila alni]|uniref:Uncharacterized protein n=1 Tax=Actinacidiphila alni TaxID=380248 RepID=A0A1I1ZQG5_9ACTN|nr:hypothetical protein [Actinacidiphila alni]SFE33947.1 hypothetical protein SAMN05216251_102541 [Actinacidiphila alni]
MPGAGVPSDAESAAEGAAAPGRDPEAGDSDERRLPGEDLSGSEGDDAGYSDLNRALGQQVHNHFHGSVDATGAAFGFGVPRAPGLAPGLVRSDDVVQTLRYYVYAEPAFTDAHTTLMRHHVVVLTGREDTGRRSGAFALLREVTGSVTGIRSLSPADALAALAAGGSLKERQAYVILDYVGETNAMAVQSYEMGRLAEELRKKHSYLVITATEGSLRRFAFEDYCAPWCAPDPLEVFRRATGVDVQASQAAPAAPAAEPLVELLGRVAEQRRPADVVAAADAFRDSGAEAALKVLSGSEAKAVADWFRRSDGPSADDLLPMAALAFLQGLPERTYEEHLAGLVRHVREWELSGESGPDDADPAPAAAGPGRAVFLRSRAQWRSRAADLVRVEKWAEPGQSDERSERRMVFTSAAVRELVIRELHELYGYELWYPLRLWLQNLSELRDLEVRSEVARGVALLARHALAEVDASMLQVWAAGLANQRVTAALTLQCMAEDDRLAGAAYNVAVGWAVNKGQPRAITMAMALAGTLGSLYRLDVLNQLWGLTGRGERLAFAARNSLVLLLQTAERDPERALFTLRYLRTCLATTRRGSSEHSRAVANACRVLAAGRLADQPGTLAGALIQSDPLVARQMGMLWAQLLLGRSRRDVIEALCGTLLAVRDQPPATEAVRVLGESMRAELTGAQWQALRTRLPAALRRPGLNTPGTHRLARILLGTLRVQADPLAL